MRILKNLTLYTPDEPDVPGALYLQDEIGNDWYESHGEFQEDTLKIQFTTAGVITSMSKEVSALWPLNQSVTEVFFADVPDGIDINGGWVFDGEKIVVRTYTPEELAAQLAVEKFQRLAAALQVIIPLQNAVKHGMATDEEKTRLEDWEKYSVLVSRVDVNQTTWPALPVNFQSSTNS